MIRDLVKLGGRQFALSLRAMQLLFVLGLGYGGVLVWKVGAGITPDHLGPLVIVLIGIAGLGGIQVLPNTAERWGGKVKPSAPINAKPTAPAWGAVDDRFEDDGRD